MHGSRAEVCSIVVMFRHWQHRLFDVLEYRVLPRTASSTAFEGRANLDGILTGCCGRWKHLNGKKFGFSYLPAPYSSCLPVSGHSGKPILVGSLERTYSIGEGSTRLIEAAVYLQRLTSAITPRWEERNMLMLVLAVLFAA